jgi:hypothetical protein
MGDPKFFDPSTVRKDVGKPVGYGDGGGCGTLLTKHTNRNINGY